MRIDIAGERFGRLVALSFAHANASGHAQWLFACDCGARIVAASGNVRAGRTRSCGCFHRELSAARLTQHGYRGARRHDATYRAWQRMKQEAPGEEICRRWATDYAAFLHDLGERPRGSVLVRLDPERGFDAANCLWSACPSRSRRAVTGWERRRLDPARAVASAPL